MPIMAACGTVDIDEVSSMEVDKNWPFAKALHQEYIELARAELAETDWADANYFADKAKSVAMADFELPGPQPVGDRDIPEGAIGDLNSAYLMLNKVLDNGRRKKPQAAARAQAMFDCWMQEQEENFQPDDIAACRKYFNIAMSALKTKPAPEPVEAVAAAPAPVPETAPMMEAGPFMIYFTYNSAALDPAASNLLKSLAEHKFAQDTDGYIVISGHTDRSGNDAYNDLLADKRSMAVYNTLMELGVKARVLSTSYGESLPVSDMTDGTKSAKNRRVEITLSR